MVETERLELEAKEGATIRICPHVLLSDIDVADPPEFDNEIHGASDFNLECSLCGKIFFLTVLNAL